MKIFVERLIACRNSMHLTQRQVALLLHLSQQGYARYESGTSQPSIEVTVLLADLFAVSVDYLYGRVDEFALVYQADKQR